MPIGNTFPIYLGLRTTAQIPTLPSMKRLKSFGILSNLLNTPTKRLNAQHLVEYQKQFLQEENKKSGNVMQQIMHSYVCGINLRSESSLLLVRFTFRIKQVYQNSTGTCLSREK